MRMSRHINAVVKSDFYHLWNIAKVRNVLTLNTSKILIHAFVFSFQRLTITTRFYMVYPGNLIDTFQHLLIWTLLLEWLWEPKYDRISPILQELHWLPMEQIIIFKINLITFKCLNNLAPSYLKELLTLYRSNRTLRSSSDKLKLVTVPYSLTTYGCRSYSSHAPILRNSLPFNIRSADSINSFKSKLKTYLFKLAY